MSEHDDCIFCNPDPKALIYSSDAGIVILDYPYREGHVLVGTKRHLPDLHDLGPKDASDLMTLAAEVSRRIVQKYGASKTYVAAVGDKDRHFHVHLLPKFEDSPNLGPFIFGPDGWAKGAEIAVTPDLTKSLRDLLSGIA